MGWIRRSLMWNTSLDKYSQAIVGSVYQNLFNYSVKCQIVDKIRKICPVLDLDCGDYLLFIDLYDV